MPPLHSKILSLADAGGRVPDGCRLAIGGFAGLEKYGLAPNFRRRVERGELEMVDYPELLSFDRFRASHTRLRPLGA